MVSTRTCVTKDSLPSPVEEDDQIPAQENTTEASKKRPRANTKMSGVTPAKGPQPKRGRKGSAHEGATSVINAGDSATVGALEKPKANSAKRPRANTGNEDKLAAAGPTKRERKATGAAKATPEVNDGDNEPIEEPKGLSTGRKGSKNASRVNKVIEPRSPLPERENRVQNPGFVDAKTGRRTSVQVAKTDKKLEALEREVEKLKEEKKMMLAQRELDQELEEVDEERTSVRKLSDVIRGAQDPLDEEDVFEDGNDGADEPDIGTSVKTSKKARQKKPARGETRSAVEALKMKIKETSKPSVKSAQTPRPRPKHLTGLVAGWASSAAPLVKPAPATPAANSIFQLGGLADDDIIAEPPEAPASALNAAAQWSNNLVLVVPSDSDSESRAVKPSLSTQATAQRKLIKKSKSTPNAHAKQGTPAVKREEGPSSIKREESSSSHSSHMSAADEQILLPRFIRADWRARFIPTLYHCLLASNDPFLDFQRSNAEKTIQLVLDTVIPGTDYEVEWDSKLCQMAYERACEVRSKFGQFATKAVKNFFGKPEYKNNPDAVVAYVKWAVRKDGPMLWRVPGPEQLPTDPLPEHKPIDIFQSQFIVEVVTPLIKPLQASVGHHVFGEPKAAFALATAGLERAFLAYKTGEFIAPTGSFSSQNVGGLVKEYMKNCDGFSARRWTQLKTACGAHIEAKAEKTVVRGFPSLEGSRGNLYIASSPPPEIVDGLENDEN